MPQRLRRPCRQPGCPELTDDGWCERHKKQYNKQRDEYRKSSRERGYTSRWEKARLTFLRSNPLCVECEKEGRLTPATVVDHIHDHKGNQELFWDVNNWQPLCKRCHDAKTMRENGVR